METEPLTARDGAAVFILVAAVLLAGWARLVPGVVGAFHDDAVYVETAKALAEGDGYRLINFPGAPPQTKYPILYPAVLAVLWRCATSLEGRLVAMQVATLVTAVLAIAGAYLYVVRFRYVERAPAFAAGALCASAPNLLYYATQTLSEMPFALALVASLWATDAYVRVASPRTGRALLTGIATVLPFLCRTVGVVVPLAAVVVVARARRPVRWMLVGVALAAVPWIAWATLGAGTLATDRVAGYHNYLDYWTTAYFGTATGSGLSLIPLIFAANLVKACVAIGNVAFEGITRVLYGASEWAATVLAVLGAAAWLAVLAHARRATLPTVTLLLYLALVCAWPWPPDRFMVPVLFFLLALPFGLATRGAVRLGGRRVGALVVGLLAIGGVLSNARTLVDYAAVNTRSHYPYFMLPDEPVRWADYDDAFTWLRTHAAPDDVLASGFDSMTALYTGHPTVRPFVPRPSAIYYAAITGDDAPALGTASDLAAVLVKYRARYLFVSPMPAFPEEDAFYELVSRVLAERPGLLRPVHQGGDGRFVIFAIAPETD